MKILMCAPYDTNGRFRGGITELACGICAAQEELNRVGLAVRKFETCRVVRSATSNGRFDLGNLKNYIACRTALADAVREEDFDAVYCHSSMKLGLLKDLLMLRHMQSVRRVHTVLHIHFGEIDKILPYAQPLRSFTLRLLAEVPDRIILLSERTKEEFVAAGIPKERLSVLYNFETLSYSEQEIRDKAVRVLQKDALHLLFIGSLCSRKGIPDLLKALSLYHTPLCIELCGSPTEEDVGEACRIAAEASEGRMKLVGYVQGNDKKDAYSRADVLVLPSYEEGLPVVLLEAYAAGCAVIATPVAAIPEVVLEKNGILVPPGDAAALAAAIDALGDDRRRLADMMTENHSAAARYTPARFLTELIEILKP